MKLDPRLSRADRIGSFVIGAGVVVYAVLKDGDQSWPRIVLVFVGLALVAGGIGGT